MQGVISPLCLSENVATSLWMALPQGIAFVKGDGHGSVDIEKDFLVERE